MRKIMHPKEIRYSLQRLVGSRSSRSHELRGFLPPTSMLLHEMITLGMEEHIIEMIAARLEDGPLA